MANELAFIVQQRIQLGLADFTKPGHLHVDVNKQDCSVILIQGSGKEYHVIAMIGQELQAMEAA